MDIEKSLTLISQEGDHVKINSKFANKSKLIQKILQDSSLDEEIQVGAEGKILRIIDKFCENHNYEPMKKIPKPLPHSDLSKFIDERDYKILQEMDEKDVYNLIKTSAYLGCEDTLEIGYAFVASIFKNKTLPELMEEYEIKEKLTPELEEKIKTNAEAFFENLSKLNPDE